MYIMLCSVKSVAVVCQFKSTHFSWQAIHEKIESLELKQVHAKIKQVDSHSTLGNGIVIQVRPGSQLSSLRVCVVPKAWRTQMALTFELYYGCAWAGTGMASLCLGWRVLTCSGSSISSQISQMLQLIPLWLLVISARSSHFLLGHPLISGHRILL